MNIIKLLYSCYLFASRKSIVRQENHLMNDELLLLLLYKYIINIFFWRMIINKKCLDKNRLCGKRKIDIVRSKKGKLLLYWMVDERLIVMIPVIATKKS